MRSGISGAWSRWASEMERWQKIISSIASSKKPSNTRKVQLPRRPGFKEVVKCSQEHALKRMLKQYERLKTTPELLENYSEVFEKWEEDGIIEDVTRNFTPKRIQCFIYPTHQ